MTDLKIKPITELELISQLTDINDHLESDDDVAQEREYEAEISAHDEYLSSLDR